MIDQNNKIEFERAVFERLEITVMAKSDLRGVRPHNLESYVDRNLDSLLMKLTSEMHERLADEKHIEFTIERPSFLDWLFRRTKKKVVTVKLKDILEASPEQIHGRPYIELIYLKPPKQ